MKRFIAALAACLTAIPNAVLNGIFFVVLFSNLLSIFDHNVAQKIIYCVAAIAGAALVFGEAFANMDAKDKGFNTTLSLIILLMVIINIGAAQYRAGENARASRQDARILAADDPRFKQLAAEKEYNQIHVLDDGRSDNDAAAIERNKQIAARMDNIVKEYVIESSSSGDKYSTVISILALVLNLIFGASVRSWYKGRDEQSATAKPFVIPSFSFLRPTSVFKVATRQPEPEKTKPATAQTPQQTAATPQDGRRVGFGYGETAINPPPPPSADAKPKIIYVPVEKIVTKTITNTETIDKTGNIKPGYNAALQEKYAENVRLVKATMQHFAGQRASLKKQADHAGIPETTYRRIRTRINNGEL